MTWEKYDTYIEKEFSELNDEVKLTFRLSVMISKCEIGYQTPSDKVQQLFKSKYNVEPSLEEIEDELQVMEYENRTPRIIEDFFQGY